jgi:lysophospholipase L1-like esterase
MSLQTINVGAVANDGTGDTERGAWIKANANFSDLYNVQGRLMNPRLIFAGDSKAVLGGQFNGDSWAAWALGIAGVEYKYQPGTDNCGVNGATCDNANAAAATNGSGAATVLGFAHDTNIAVVTGRVSARAAAGENVVLWIQVGTNSTGSDTAHLAALQKVINACRAAGARLFLVNDVPPLNTSSASVAANIGSINARLEEWVKTQTDVKIIKHHAATVDTASAFGIPFGGASGAAFAATKDGTHESYYGAYLQGRAMAPQIAELFRKTPIRLGGKGDVYQAFFGASAYPASGLTANMNKNPFLSGTGGTDGLAKSGTASVTGSVPDQFRLTGSISGDVSIALSQVSSDYLNALFKRADLTCVRMAFSGTPTANDSIKLEVDPQGASPSRHPVLQDATPITGLVIAQANVLTGVQELAIQLPGKLILQNTNSSYAHNALPPLSELLIMKSVDATATPTVASPVNYIGPPSLGVRVTLRNGIAVSGSVDLIYCDQRLILAAPAALT